MLRESEPNQADRVLKQEKQRKIRSRRQRVSQLYHKKISSKLLFFLLLQLFDRRKKFLKEGEKKFWQQLSIQYMSMESSDEEGTIVVHRLPWRSKSRLPCT